MSCAQSIIRPPRKIQSPNKLSVWLRKNRSTKLASTLLLDDIQKSVDCRELVGAVFVDLFKVFNTIGNEILLSKLPLYGIHNTIILNYHGLLITCSQGSN